MTSLGLAVFGAAFAYLTSASVIVRRDLTPPTTPKTGWSYTGCFVDSVNSRSLNGAVYYDSTDLTAETCVAYCAGAGYSFAGMEYAVECYCGDTMPEHKVADSDCDMACSGDSSQPCGAGNRLSVFNGSSTYPTPPAIPGWSYAGCLKEGSTGRALTTQVFLSGGAASMTNELCVAACEASGFSLAGTEYAGECYCGNEYANGGGDQGSGCNMKCSGDDTQMCGGPNRLSAWALGDSPLSSSSSATVAESTTVLSSAASSTVVVSTIKPTSVVSSAVVVSTTKSTSVVSSSDEETATFSTDETISSSNTPSSTSSTLPSISGLPGGWAYKGCYVDPPGRAMAAAPNSPLASNTPKNCIAACIANGFTVAGMEYSNECYCGKELINGASKADEADCNMSCSGDDDQTCGAGNRLSIYSKGDFSIWPVPSAKKTGLPGSWEYKGCVYDNPYIFPWLWEDATDDASSNMTINTCLERCQEFGYPAAGVEYARQCVCGDIGAVQSREDAFRDDSDCGMICPGDRNHTCGAGNYFNYYEWAGTPFNSFHYASGYVAGEYDFFSTSPIVALISSVGINDKVVFVEKHGTSWDNTEGSFEFDYSTNTYRELALKTDVFCSASFTMPDKAGRIINIGGWSAESIYGVRFFTPDSPQGVDNGTNVWEEDFSELHLFDPRWYPTALILSNGSLLAMGGESGSDAPIVPTCEVLPHPAGVTESTYLDYLARADEIDRRNSYPFLAILPSGNIFFAQFNESRIISQTDFQSIRKLPDMPGAVDNPLTGRNYPLQGSMMIMPQKAPYTDPLRLLICGGTTVGDNTALDNCVSMAPEVQGAEWTLERMPSKRVMPTIVALPDGRYLIINGAQKGRGGFGLADNANLNAVMYDPEQPLGYRMTVLANTTLARLYHSEGILLSNGKVLVSGSDPQDNKHPQEHRLEYFWPDYLLSGAEQPKFSITERDWAYGEDYSFTLDSSLVAGVASMRVSLMASIGSTHGVTMGQRTLFPAFSCDGRDCSVTAPPDAFVSPPSWYQMFVLDGPTPSHAIWVRIGGDPAALGNWPNLPGFTTPGV